MDSMVLVGPLQLRTFVDSMRSKVTSLQQEPAGGTKPSRKGRGLERRLV